MSRVYFPVTALGPGRRLGMWFQGCSIGCAGCIARDTWQPDSGTEVSVGQLAQLWQSALGAGATGLTISGGEPADQPDALVELLTAVRDLRSPNSQESPDILLYTGYELDEFVLRVPGGAELVDVMITGPYDIRQPTALIWRGSANQQLHLLTPLGNERYTDFVDHIPEATPMQVAVDDHDIWYVGVPRAGDLSRLDRALRSQGIVTDGTSWRP
jgi:anaerobic ribonucleoside-triphosphate reductase activating protein